MEELGKSKLVITLKNVLQRSENKKLCEDWPAGEAIRQAVGRPRTGCTHGFNAVRAGEQTGDDIQSLPEGRGRADRQMGRWKAAGGVFDAA